LYERFVHFVRIKTIRCQPEVHCKTDCKLKLRQLIVGCDRHFIQLADVNGVISVITDIILVCLYTQTSRNEHIQVTVSCMSSLQMTVGVK